MKRNFNQTIHLCIILLIKTTRIYQSSLSKKRKRQKNETRNDMIGSMVVKRLVVVSFRLIILCFVRLQMRNTTHLITYDKRKTTVMRQIRIRLSDGTMTKRNKLYMQWMNYMV